METKSRTVVGADTRASEHVSRAEVRLTTEQTKNGADIFLGLNALCKLAVPPS